MNSVHPWYDIDRRTRRRYVCSAKLDDHQMGSYAAGNQDKSSQENPTCAYDYPCLEIFETCRPGSMHCILPFIVKNVTQYEQNDDMQARSLRSPIAVCSAAE